MRAAGQPSLLGLVSSFLGDNNCSTTRSEASQSNAPIETSGVDNEDLEEEMKFQSPCVKIVLFSKDRPWQLQELFRSMCLNDGCVDDDVDIKVSIDLLANITENYQMAYEEVIASVESILESVSNVTLTCHREDPADVSSFQSLFESVLNEDGTPTHWMFVTDDCLLLVSLRELLQTALPAFSSDAKVKCFLSRLHPGITWTQTRSLPSPPPRSFFRYLPRRSTHDVNGVYVYPLQRGDLDWAYPWDLSGGIYSDSFVRKVFQKLQDRDGLSHPNRMEIAGNNAIAPMTKKNFLVSVPTRPMLLILAINRVQSVCQAPLACAGTDAPAFSAEALLSFYHENKRLDTLRYKAIHFNSSHVGDLYVLDDIKENNDMTTDEKHALSVLIPVHTGPPQAAAHAIRSIMMQPIEEYRDNRRESCLRDDIMPISYLSPMQIVIVDDRCTDGSIDAMKEALWTIATEHLVVCMTIKDYRQGDSKTIDGSKPVPDSSIDARIQLCIDIVQSPRPGIAGALNHGLSYCQSDFVARMDADDIAEPGRLRTQVAALRYQLKLAVVGTSVLLVRKETAAVYNTGKDQQANSTCLSTNACPYSLAVEEEHHSTMNVVTSLPPTDAGFASWAMLFSCSIAHPSIVYRKKPVLEAGGYNEDLECAEDYELWLRMTTANCSSLVSIPKIGLWHRKHRSRSHHTSKQHNEAHRASIHAMEVLLGTGSERSNGQRLASAASVLRKPDKALSLQQVNEAADLLTKIEVAFLRHHNDALTAREVALIRKDCDERIGELATLAVQKSLLDPGDVNKSVAWKIWCERCPELTMNRVALLCHNYRGHQHLDTTNVT